MTDKVETTRCPDCGALLVLVGLKHLSEYAVKGQPRKGQGRHPLRGRKQV